MCVSDVHFSFFSQTVREIPTDEHHASKHAEPNHSLPEHDEDAPVSVHAPRVHHERLRLFPHGEPPEGEKRRRCRRGRHPASPPSPEPLPRRAGAQHGRRHEDGPGVPRLGPLLAVLRQVAARAPKDTVHHAVLVHATTLPSSPCCLRGVLLSSCQEQRGLLLVGDRNQRQPFLQFPSSSFSEIRNECHLGE